MNKIYDITAFPAQAGICFKSGFRSPLLRGIQFILLLILISIILPSRLSAQETGPLFSGAYLLRLCESDENGKETIEKGHAACQAYIAGVIDYQDMLRSLGTYTSVDMCVPNTVKMNDLQNIVWKYLEVNAQHDNFGAAPAVGLALSQVFPCKKP